jgi:hypothetical protein
MSENIVTWDFMGWKENSEPEVGLQLKWNKTLLEKFTQVSSQINRNSLRGGADTIIMYPALEGLLHPDYYDSHRKILMGYKIVFDDMIHYTMVKTTTFNGVRHPSIGIWTKENDFKLVKKYGYEDYKNRLS